jgi:hypothetical protein
MARTAEQGLGRSVRGEKDYSVILMIGPDLVKQFRAKNTRKYFSEQTQTQINIGLKVMEFAKEDIAGGKKPNVVFIELMNQCLKRDSGWKTYYEQQMSKNCVRFRSINSWRRGLTSLAALGIAASSFASNSAESAVPSGSNAAFQANTPSPTKT